MTKRILICGGRDFDNRTLLYETLDDICFVRNWRHEPDEYGNWLPDVVVIQGGARGADSIADEWAVVNWCVSETYEADWKQYGASAGPIRNQKMLTVGKPDLVVAFPTPASRGTWDMVERAKKAGIEVMVIES